MDPSVRPSTTPDPAILRELDGLDDAALAALIARDLSTPLIGDVMDALGSFHRFLSPRTRPVHPRLQTLAGRAMPMRYADVTGPQARPFGRLTEALDQIQPGEVVVIAGGSQTYATWGELLTATARTRGGIGAIIDGYHRDTPQVISQNWPVFSYGGYAQDAGVRGAVIDVRCPVEINGTWIAPGDLMVGDVDGVLAIPRSIERTVLALALTKARGERVVRRAIEGGMSSTEAFRTYGIL
jgi:4-hydroxy-4-methyl-2-oxoglutarate aldolase